MSTSENQSFDNNRFDIHPAFVNKGSYFSYIHRIQFLYNKIVFKTLYKSGVDITPDQMPVLYVIKSVPGITQQDIAKGLARDKASVTRTIKSFVNKNIITSTPSKIDNRKNILSLTDKGEQIAIIIHEKFKSLDDRLNTDIAQMATTAVEDNFQKLESLSQLLLSIIEEEDIYY